MQRCCLWVLHRWGARCWKPRLWWWLLCWRRAGAGASLLGLSAAPAPAPHVLLPAMIPVEGPAPRGHWVRVQQAKTGIQESPRCRVRRHPPVRCNMLHSPPCQPAPRLCRPRFELGAVLHHCRAATRAETEGWHEVLEPGGGRRRQQAAAQTRLQACSQSHGDLKQALASSKTRKSANLRPESTRIVAERRERCRGQPGRGPIGCNNAP